MLFTYFTLSALFLSCTIETVIETNNSYTTQAIANVQEKKLINNDLLITFINQTSTIKVEIREAYLCGIINENNALDDILLFKNSELSPQESISIKVSLVPQILQGLNIYKPYLDENETYIKINGKVYQEQYVMLDGDIYIPIKINLKNNTNNEFKTILDTLSPWYRLSDNGFTKILIPITFDVTVNDWE